MASTELGLDRAWIQLGCGGRMGRKRKRETATAMDALISTRKLRLVCLAVTAMSRYGLVHEVLREDGATTNAEEDAAQDMLEMSWAYDFTLVLAQLALLLSAAAPYCKPGRTYE